MVMTPKKIMYESSDTIFELCESTGASKEMKVMGVAINETITRNKVKYQAEELQKAASTLKGKPILKDHNNSVDSIVGRVTESKFEGDKITYKGVIRDDNMMEKIQKGLITNVSIGAQVEDAPEEEDDQGMMCRVAKGLEFLELSLVAVPGDSAASITQALTEAFKIKQDITIEKSPPAQAEEVIEKQAEAKLMTEQNDAALKEIEELRAFKKAAEEKERNALIESATTYGWTKEDLASLPNEAIRKIAEMGAKKTQPPKGKGEVATEADKTQAKIPIKLTNGLTMVRARDEDGRFFSVDTDKTYKERFFPYCYGRA